MKYMVNDGVLHKYEKEKSKLRNFGAPLGAWSVRLDFLTPDVHTVVYETMAKVYRISAADVKMNGLQRIFQGEPKYIVPIKYWKVTKKEGNNA